ncbi:MAG TPA: TetR/AcrR family transcriptional regulator [Caulobacteraceae bacterium]|nr:TetR/AcrR family transcriptional regulator [Caulobacteraceae bacterium]
MGRPKRIEDEELLRIARAVFVVDGAHGSTREIAQRAGISEAALFKRYPTKAELFLAAMMPPNVDVDALVAGAEAVEDPLESLVVLAERMLDYFREAIPVIRQLTQNPLIDLESVRRRFGVGPEQRLAAAVPDYFVRQRERGLLACPDPHGSALLLIAAVHSIVLFELMSLHEPRDGPAAIRAIVAAHWNGLRPQGAPP